MKTKPKILCIFGNYFNLDNIAYIDVDNRLIKFNCCGNLYNNDVNNFNNKYS